MEEVFSYSEIILDLYKNPLNYGHLSNPELKAKGGNPLCGDEVSFELKLDGEKVKDIKFTGIGCAISKASASLLTEMVKGKTLREIKAFGEKEIFQELGGIIQTRVKCALLSLVVLKRGIEEYQKNSGKKTVLEGVRI